MVAGDAADERTPPANRPARSPVRRYLLVAVDTVYHALVVTAVVFVGLTVLSFAVKTGWLGVKYGLFVLGVLLFGVGAIGLRPKSAWKEDETVVEPRSETRLGGFIQRFPPLRRRRLDPDERLSPAAKRFLSGVFVLATSFVMEAVFGVAV